MKLVLLIILVIFLLPTYTFGGIPVRLEDLFFVIIIVFFPKLTCQNANGLFRILVLTVFAAIISFFIQIFLGYAPILSDMNTIFSLVRNVVIFYAGLKLGEYAKGNISSLLLIITSGFFMCSIISFIQYYDIGGLGRQAYLLYSTKERIKWGVVRVVGSAGNPNIAAFFQLCGLIGVLCVREQLGKFKNLISFSLIALSIWSVYLTFSRTGLFSMVIILFMYLILTKKYTATLFIGALLMVIAPFLNTLIEGTRYALAIGDNAVDLGTVGNRDTIWEKKLIGFYENPVWGIGSSKGLFSNTGFDIVIFDNSFLYLLVSGGIVGIVITLLFHFQSIILFKKKKNTIIYIYILLIHINIFVFYITTDLVKTVMFTSYYFMTIGILLSYFNNNRLNEKNESFNIHTDSKLEQS